MCIIFLSFICYSLLRTCKILYTESHQISDLSITDMITPCLFYSKDVIALSNITVSINENCMLNFIRIQVESLMYYHLLGEVLKQSCTEPQLVQYKYIALQSAETENTLSRCLNISTVTVIDYSSNSRVTKVQVTLKTIQLELSYL